MSLIHRAQSTVCFHYLVPRPHVVIILTDPASEPLTPFFSTCRARSSTSASRTACQCCPQAPGAAPSARENQLQRAFADMSVTAPHQKLWFTFCPPWSKLSGSSPRLGLPAPTGTHTLWAAAPARKNPLFPITEKGCPYLGHNEM